MGAVQSGFNFVGRAFLSANVPELARLLRELRNTVQPMTPLASQLERMDRALTAGAAAELQSEHARLFLDPKGAPCPPWQSAYADEPQPLGPAHRSALAWFRAVGIEPKNADQPADHAGLLMAFYGTLVEVGADPEIRAAFYEEHLAWMPQFLDRVIAEARHEFYRALAEAAAGLLAQARPSRTAT